MWENSFFYLFYLFIFFKYLLVPLKNSWGILQWWEDYASSHVRANMTDMIETECHFRDLFILMYLLAWYTSREHYKDSYSTVPLKI